MNMEELNYDDKTYKTLIGLAEFFRCSQPPRLRECIHSLQATLAIEGLPLLLQAHSRLCLAKLLLQFTRNVGHARSHLEQAHQISMYLQGLDAEKVYFESTSFLAKVNSELNQNTNAKEVLRKALERSSASDLKHWHYRLIFQLAEAHAHDKETDIAVELLSMLGEPTAKHNNHNFVCLMYMLSRCLLLLADKNLRDFEKVLHQTEPIKNEFLQSASSKVKKTTIQVFCGFLKVYYYVVTGRPKTGKSDLKDLQVSIQTLISLPEDVQIPGDPEAFHWMTKDHLCILVYLVTVMHYMHAGAMDKALRYTEKALAQIERLKAVGNESQLTIIFQLSLMEHAVMSRIIQGQGSTAIQEISSACKLCSGDPKIAYSMKPVLHTLLGIYAMSMNLMADAEMQFKKAMTLSNNTCDVFSVSALNLAIIYTREGNCKRLHLRELLSTLNSHTIAKSKSLRAGYFYMMGLKSFFDSSYDDSKKFLRESLRIGNAEDLTRATACSLILLGHVITLQTNTEEALGMIRPAMEVATRIPDVYLQLWAASLLKDIYRLLNQPHQEQKEAQHHHMYTTQLLQDHFLASQKPEHNLIKDCQLKI